MPTTIQLSKQVKKNLEKFKEGKETYEDVILSLIKVAEKQKKEREELLRKGYVETAEKSLKISKEWEFALMDGLDKNEKWNY